MRALRVIGLAILTALAPIPIILGNSPVAAATDLGRPCSQEGAKVWGVPGPTYCQRQPNGQLQWVPIPASALCVAFCVNDDP